MLAAEGDTYFKNVALPVDVFHFKAKHKQSDEVCGRYCNPARQYELINKTTGNWVFNSSAAEQVSTWFCKFHVMTRLMHQDQYALFHVNVLCLIP
jgi:hypothetical protein